MYVFVFPCQLDRFIPITKLKYYFAVDTVYVGKKLGLLVFPYMHEVSLFTPSTSKFLLDAFQLENMLFFICLFVLLSSLIFLMCSKIFQALGYLERNLQI